MKTVPVIILLLLINSLFLCADEKSTYLELLQNNKMKELETHLSNWEKSKPNDPEMFIGFFNYYINMARKENIVFGGQNPPKNETMMIISDPKTGEKVGYMYGEVSYDKNYSEKALQIINKGLNLYPNRLDMHFGKTRLLAELKAYEEQRDYLLKVFAIGKQNHNKWQWSDSKSLDKSEQVFIDSIHDYISEWLNSENKKAFECIKPISESLIASFPKSVIGYNDCGLYYAISGDLENAEAKFLAGYNVDQKDEIIIGNLAYLYESKNDIVNAKKYYTLLSKSTNKDSSDFAKKKLSELGK